MTSSSSVRRALVLVASAASIAGAQTLDDPVLMPRRTLLAGAVYARDSWDQYWEGTLKRSNGNIGTLTTRSVVAMAQYGITDRLTASVTLPYVETEASQGVLQGQHGLQDLTIGLKFRALSTAIAGQRTAALLLAGSASTPASHYTPDFLPFSIGSGGGRANLRAIVDVDAAPGVSLSAFSGYTWCRNVTLDRGAYYTSGQLFLTNQVQMHDVADFGIRAAYARGRFQLPVALVAQRTLGGDDIRRQDMPFMSNRMNFNRLQGAAMWLLPANFTFQVGGARVLSGRNVGQSTTLMTGLMYALHL